MKLTVYFAAVAFASVALICDSRAYSQLVEPSTSVGGVSQSEWVARWGQWYLSYPNHRRPERDDFSYLGDQGTVFFLASPGGLGEQEITFDVIISSEDYVFLNLLSVWVWPDDPWTETEEELRAYSAQLVDNVDSLFLEIDGVHEFELWDHRQTSPPGLIDVTLPDDNIILGPAGVYPSVFEGYYAMLEPLAIGEHTIHFGGSVDDGPDLSTLANVTVVPAPLPGDFDADGNLSVADINLLTAEVATAIHTPALDLNADQLVDTEDLRMWVKELKATWFGDANLDGKFNSSDLVAVFEAGEYEDDLPNNSVWSTGDWNGDAEFDSGDVVVAFQDGGYEKGPLASVGTVPEPATWVMLTAGLIGIAIRRRNKQCVSRALLPHTEGAQTDVPAQVRPNR